MPKPFPPRMVITIYRASASDEIKFVDHSNGIWDADKRDIGTITDINELMELMLMIKDDQIRKGRQEDIVNLILNDSFKFWLYYGKYYNTNVTRLNAMEKDIVVELITEKMKCMV